VCPESTYAERSEPAAASVPLLIDPIYFMGKMLEGLASGDADKSLAYARHYIEQLEAAGSTSQAKRLRDAMDGTARMVGLAAPAGAHCNDCTDPHCHGSALAVSREASVPLHPAASGGTQEFTAAEVEAWIEEESRYLNERTLAMLRAYARLLSPPAFINNEHGEKLNSAPSPAPTGAEGPAKTWFDECEENR
jgi:hypothetical protein